MAMLSESKLSELKNEISEYSHTIEKIIKEKNHSLSTETEKILAAKTISGREPLGGLYSKIVSQYTFDVEVDGEMKTLNGEQTRNLRYHPNVEVRRNAMKIFFKRYEKDETVIAGLYNVIVNDYDMDSKIRKFDTPISMRNLDNEVNDEIVKKLMKVTTANTDIVADYYDWKAKFMDIDMELSDIYVSLKDVGKKYDFETSKEIVLSSYYDFSQEAGDIVKSFFDEERIHSELTPGKIGGAFCSYYIPNRKPFVLLNHTDSIRDVMTMAHELGHGLHGTLSADQNFANFHTPLTMAETASIFGEFLVMDKLLLTLNKEEKKIFIASKVEDSFATTFRQNMFARFEVESHRMISEEGFVSYAELSELYERELKSMFHDSVKITPEYHREWSSIPHIFHVPFYVYAYNFANLLVIALYQKYREEGKNFMPLFLELLKSGGKDNPEKLLAKLGIDLTDESFWQKGFDFIREMVDSLK